MNKRQSQQNIYFNREEEGLSKYIEKTNLKPLEKAKEKELIDKLANAAKNTLAKKKVVSLRLSERDLLYFKAKAAEEGIPYQTLMTSVLHKYIFS